MAMKTTKDEAAVDRPQLTTGGPGASPEAWRRHLEIIGAELFQRYRKRLLSPGVVREIRRDYPGLSLPDVLVRVHAGRRLIEQGEDFRALAAIRSGDWQRHLERRVILRRSDPEAGRDRVSRALVKTGGGLFATFCLLSLAPALSAGAVILAPLLLIVTVGMGLFLRRRYRNGPWQNAGNAVRGGNDPMPSL